MNEVVVIVIAFLFGFAALAVVVLCLYAFSKMNEQDVMDLLIEENLEGTCDRKMRSNELSDNDAKNRNSYPLP